MQFSLSTITSLLKDTFNAWKKDNAGVWCAAISYYTTFSLAPLLLIVISVAGLLFGKSAIEGHIYNQLKGLIGSSGANMVEQMIANVSQPKTSIIASIIGIVTLLLGAAGVFGQLKQALNHIWGVRPKQSIGIWGMIRDRLLNFSMVIVIGFLLAVSLVVSAGITAVSMYFHSYLPFSATVVGITDFVISLLILMLLFALLFKIMPDVRVPWRNVGIGAVITALLFTIGKSLIGIYLGHSSISSTYGAAASLAVILVWVYYAAQIVFIGAEFTKVYTLRRTGEIVPSKYGVVEESKKVEKPELSKNEKFVTRILGFLLSGVVYQLIKRFFSREEKGKRK